MAYAETAAQEGDVGLFELTAETEPVVLESSSGRAMTIAPGDLFLATPGHRESTRWVVGCIPSGGLLPGEEYCILADCGIVGSLMGDSPLEKHYVGRVTYRGAVVANDGQVLNIRQFVERVDANAVDHRTQVFLLVGTSAEVGKTTAGIGLLQALRHKGYANVLALKATGTSSLTELLRYQDFGAFQVFDCVDFGLPTTYPSGRDDIGAVFERALDATFSAPSEAVLIECGGDILGGNVPVFLECLRRRQFGARIVLVAADALGALGGKRVLEDMDLSVSLITGPCTDTPTLQQRTQALCGIPSMNMRGSSPTPDGPLLPHALFDT